jgi:hypothetical protein
MQTFSAHRQKSPGRSDSRHPYIMAGGTLQRGSGSLDRFHLVFLDPNDVEKEILRAYVRVTVMPDQNSDMIVSSVCADGLVLTMPAELVSDNSVSARHTVIAAKCRFPTAHCCWLQTYCVSTSSYD